MIIENSGIRFILFFVPRQIEFYAVIFASATHFFVNYIVQIVFYNGYQLGIFYDAFFLNSIFFFRFFH